MSDGGLVKYWEQKRVVVTGGSAGFGKRMATSLVRAGAKVIVTARDTTRLENAVAELNAELNAATSTGQPGEVVGIEADVTNEADVEHLFQQVQERWGGLDALVNNVGRSDRGRLMDLSAERLRQSWETNTLSAFLCTKAAMPMLVEAKGHVVFIGSLAAKSAAKYLGAYAMNKFPLAALAQQLRYELADAGVHVMLVCPGPISRDDAGGRYDELTSNLPDEAQRPGGGVKIKTIDPEWLAERILVLAAKRCPELVVPAKSRILFAVSQLSPRLGDWILRRMT
jgi:NAD(P)-dependent dehydrogenase (short-subunit alcohol dehydrogenase family)